MFNLSKTSKLKFFATILMVCFIALINQISFGSKHLDIIMSKLAIFLFILIVVFWGIEVQKRVLDQRIKIIFLYVDLMMIVLMFLKFIRYTFFQYGNVGTILWYCYYIPLIFIPVFVLSSSLQISNIRYKRIEYFKYLYYVAAAFCILILTNNHHQLVFKFYDNNPNHYTYGVVYYIIYIWLILLMIISILICYFRSKRALNRKRLWVQWIWIFLTILYSCYYVYGPFLLKSLILQLQEYMCLMFMGFIEFSIQAGLFPTNMLYPELFDNSSISAIIQDDAGSTIYTSLGGKKITQQQIAKVKDANVYLFEDQLIHNQRIDNGHIIWVDNVKTINQLTSSLNEINEQLSGKNELLIAENKLKEKQAAIKEKTALYNVIDDRLQIYFEKIESLIHNLKASNENYRFKMSMACFYLAYIKRMSNLLILSKQNKTIDLQELYLSINELLHQSNYLGISNVCIIKNEGKMPSESLTMMYQIVLEILEDCLQQIESCFISISCNNSVYETRIQLFGQSIKVNLGDFKDSLEDYHLFIDHTIEDDEYYFNICYKGGEQV